MATNKIDSKSLLILLLTYLRPVAARNSLGIMALIAHSYLLIRIPVYVKYVINGLEIGISKPELVRDCLMIVGLAFCAGICLFLARWFIIGASREIEMNLRNDFFLISKNWRRVFTSNSRRGIS
ncbi:MAG: hypothetical protein C4527_15395 [Candidatus Omnitrophota bacterium]|jgi:ATP-binding cassette subfamily B protein|nr:MAG: hypothetical protein C4527_15395 [Candidatus Omnitrophota bacterium]